MNISVKLKFKIPNIYNKRVVINVHIITPPMSSHTLCPSLSLRRLKFFLTCVISPNSILSSPNCFLISLSNCACFPASALILMASYHINIPIETLIAKLILLIQSTTPVRVIILQIIAP